MENNVFIQFIAGFVVSVAFAIFFNAPRKSLFTCGLIGAIGWLIQVVVNLLLADVVVSSFLGPGYYIYLYRDGTVSARIWYV